MTSLSILAPLALVAGLVLGLLVDAVGSSGRINILAPPLLGLMLWNIAVYVLLAVMHLRGGADAPRPLRHALSRGLHRLGVSDASQLAPALHAGAAAFALGALAAMYLRGVAFEYRAGWETTFLSVDTVQRLLAFVLGPASRLTGLPLPGAAELDALRFGPGGGESAARWIHLYAVTVLLVVVLPRVLLAVVAAHPARRAATPPDTRDTLAVRVLPYSYHVEPARLQALAGAVERSTGRRVAVSIAEALPLGAEDELDRLLPDKPPALAALFSLSATPETENHGAFVAALAARSHEPPLVLVDESAFVRRFTGAEAATRRDERRRAWINVIGERGLTPQFVDLGA